MDLHYKQVKTEKHGKAKQVKHTVQMEIFMQDYGMEQTMVQQLQETLQI